MGEKHKFIIIGFTALFATTAAAVSCVDKSGAPHPVVATVRVESTAASVTVPADPLITATSAANVPGVSAVIRCGDVPCRVGQAMCCRKGPKENHRCFPMGEITRESSHGECNHSTGLLLQCDDSADCPSGHVCCMNDRDQGSKTLCVPARPDGANACDHLELCTKDDTCRTADTICREERCRRPLDQVRCGKQRCTPDQPVCCGPFNRSKGYRCGTAEECKAKSLPSIRKCELPKDCPRGSHCHHNLMGSWCAGEPHYYPTTRLACETDADCPERTCPVGPEKGGCIADGKCGCPSMAKEYLK